MGKDKIRRFAEFSGFSNVMEPKFADVFNQDFHLKGKWNQEFFTQSRPLTLELGCGKGEYTVDLAGRYSANNYIGLDKKGARMWRGARTTKENSLPNVAFVRIKVENLTEIFAVAEVDEIWITFPEPQLNSPKTKKRFTSPQFLKRYSQILKPGGIIHLKTDNDFFFNYTMGVISEFGHTLVYSNQDLYSHTSDPEVKDVIPVQTHYEKMWLEKGLKIKYLRFILQQ